MPLKDKTALFAAGLVSQRGFVLRVAGKAEYFSAFPQVEVKACNIGIMQLVS